MIRRIALTLCAAVAVLAGVACLPETASQTAPTASAGKVTVDVAAQSARRSGYIVASS
jgi:hypothetical protein